MSADALFALVTNLLGIPTLVYGLQVDVRSRAERAQRHLRVLRRAVDAVEAAAHNLLRTDLSGPGLKAHLLVGPRQRLFREIEALGRAIDNDLTPEFVFALRPERLLQVSATECVDRLDGASDALGLLLGPLTRPDRRQLRAAGKLAAATTLEILVPPLAARRDRLRRAARTSAAIGTAAGSERP